MLMSVLSLPVSLLLVLPRIHCQGQLMEVNTDIKKALRAILVVYWMLLQYKKRQGPRDVSLREKWVSSIKRKDFIPGEQQRVCSLHFHGAKKQRTSDVPEARHIRRPYYISIASSVKTEKASKNTFATRTSSQGKEIRAGKSKSLADAGGKEVDFFVCTCLFQ